MPFVPGQSGNPKGAPRKSLSLAEALRQRFPVEELLEVAAGLLASEDDNVRLKTLTLVWDRMFGKAPTVVEIASTGQDAKVDWSAVSADKRRQLLAAVSEVTQLATVVEAEPDGSVEH